MKRLIIKTKHDEDLQIEKRNDGILCLGIRSGPYGPTYAYLNPEQKKTLLEFLNRPEPREWMVEVSKQTGSIVSYDRDPYCPTEYVKVREVINE